MRSRNDPANIIVLFEMIKTTRAPMVFYYTYFFLVFLASAIYAVLIRAERPSNDQSTVPRISDFHFHNFYRCKHNFFLLRLNFPIYCINSAEIAIAPKVIPSINGTIGFPPFFAVVFLLISSELP